MKLLHINLLVGKKMAKMGRLFFVKGLKNAHIIPDLVDTKVAEFHLVRIINPTRVF